MIEESAVVTRCQGAHAEIEAQRHQGGCGNCTANGCATASLARFWGSKRSRIMADNPIGAQPGERVVVGFQETALARASVVFYLYPLVGLIGLSVLADWLGRMSGHQVTELGTVLAGLFGLIVGLSWARFRSLRYLRDRRFQPVILRRAQTSSSSPGVVGVLWPD
jgi:sigma-E factor negative regulatory protein RseC